MSELNDSQKRYVRSIFGEINRYLENIEALLRPQNPSCNSVMADICSDERAHLESFTRTVRAGLAGISQRISVAGPEAPVSARWGVLTNIEFMNVELMELTRAKLAGYGRLDELAFKELHAAVASVHAMIMHQLEDLGHRS